MVSELKERAARARAARGYAGLNQTELARKLGVSVETLSRLENGHRQISIEELQRIGEACGVSQAFIESGFEIAAAERPDPFQDAPAGERGGVTRVQALIRRLDELERDVERLRGLEDQVAELRRSQPTAAQLAETFAAALRATEPPVDRSRAQRSEQRQGA